METGNNEEKKWIEEICVSNGLEGRGKSDFKNTELLELFLSTIPYVPEGITNFQSLSVLRFVGCQIKSIDHLQELLNLKELWICEGKLQKISGLEKCHYIESLYLYDNDIKKIENLSHLSLLKTLWLNKNKIQFVENIGDLKRLKVLNLSDNKIKYIDKSMEKNFSLEELNLSGNLISSFKDIMNLSQLPYLKSLSFKDPMSPPNPVSFLCNYSTYVLYHIPTLTKLDSFNVHQKNLKDLAEIIVSKKKMFYNMKIKTLERMFTSLKAKLKDEMEKLQECSVASLHKLISVTKEIERELSYLKKTNYSDEVNNGKSNQIDISVYKLKKKLDAINARAAFWEDKYERYFLSFQEVVEQARQWTKNNICHMMIEYASGGNVRFEEGSTNDQWYNSCQDLIQSRFFAQEFKDQKITGLKVHKITRVQNRILKMNFDTKFDIISGGNDTISVYKDSSGKRLIDYLFLVFDQKVIHPNDCIKVLEDGFNSIEELQKSSNHALIQLTNSIQVCDKQRIKTTLQRQTNKTIDQSPFRFGQLVICKVYLGKSTMISTEKRISKSAGYDSIYRARKHPVSTCPNKTKKGQLTDQCDCTARRCTWFVFDTDLVLPEYLVDFEYLTMNTPSLTSIFSAMAFPSKPVDTATTMSPPSYLNMDGEQELRNDEVINMEPLIASKPRLTFLTEDLLLQQSMETNLNTITELNLHGSGLAKVKLLSSLTSLKKLILSFNELTTMNDLGGISSLEYLDVSFNQINGLDGFKVSSNLSYVDISWNCFYYTREEVGLIRKYMPALKVLRTSHNPWMKNESLRLRCIGRLRSLVVMNDQPVTDEETTIALRLAAGSRIAYITTLAYSRTDNELPRTLTLASSTETLMSYSHNKPVKLNEDDKLWFIKVTCLHLDNQHLSKISNLEKLENLKWASFKNNDITKIEGLEYCPNLIELLLSGNCISKLEGLNHLNQLEYLDLSNNNIASLDGIAFDQLHELKYLAVDNNHIMSLHGLQNAPSLVEIYAGNNKIQYTREIFKLKSIMNLIILDLLGNELACESHYRLFLIYHLPHLKVLDGIPVSSSEGDMAKEAFGGKLTTDFITERLGHSNFSEICELDLPNCNLQTVDLSGNDFFKNLRSLNLEQNNLTHFGGIVNLVNLKVLCLNHNHIESIIAKRSGESSPTTTKSIDQTPQMLENLEVLHLGYNGISNLSNMQFARIPSLKALFLQGNEISKVEGLDGLFELKELVLDKNKIKGFQANSFKNQWKLTELHVEDNRIRDMTHLECLTNLRRLYIGMNRIQDMTELEKLESFSNLFELSVIGNPVARRLLHRPLLVFRQPNLLSIDGIPVTNDERSKAEMYFIEQQGGLQALQAITGSIEQPFPGLIAKSKNPLKVSNYLGNFSNEPYWNNNSSPQSNEDFRGNRSKNHKDNRNYKNDSKYR